MYFIGDMTQAFSMSSVAMWIKENVSKVGAASLRNKAYKSLRPHRLKQGFINIPSQWISIIIGKRN
jgi:hypothetical protein